MIDVYRESSVSPVGHGGSTATGPSIVRLAFALKRARKGQASSRLPAAKLTTFKLSAAQL